jgi:acyl carrier protein
VVTVTGSSTIHHQEERSMMTQDQILDTVTNVVARQLSIDKEAIRGDASFIGDLGADSLDTVELLMSFEDAFGVKIPDRDAQQLSTVQSAVDYVSTRLMNPPAESPQGCAEQPGVTAE